MENKEPTNPVIHLVLLFAVGIVVLMNFFEVRKLRYSLTDGIEANQAQVNNVAGKVEDVRSDLEELRQKLNSAFAQIAH